MKKTNLISLGFASLLAVATSGCAFTKTPVNLDFHPHPTAEKVSVDKVLVVQPLQDQRGIDSRVLSYKATGYGTKTTGAFVTEKPLADIVTDAVRDTLKELNYKTDAGQGDLILSGELLRLDSTVLMGFWSGEMDCTIQVNLRLTDGKSGKPIWNELFTGFNKKTGLQMDHEGHRKDTTEAALADLTGKLAASESFRKAVQTGEN